MVSQSQPQKPGSQGSSDSHECARGCKENRGGQRGFSDQSMVKPTPHSTNMFSVLEKSTVGSTKNMLTPQLSVMTEPRTEQAMHERPPYPYSNLTPIFISSATLCRGTEIPLQIHMVDRNAPLTITTLVDSGATRQFIDIEYVWSKN